MAWKNKIPQCIGIIPDGNRRWAKEEGLTPLDAHAGASKKFGEVVLWVRDRGIKHMMFYAFSTENWSRNKEEVDALIELFHKDAGELLIEALKENIRVRFVGEWERFDEDMQELMKKVEEESKDNTAMTAWIGLSYGGRREITAAARAAAAEGEVTEESISKHLWTAGMPDPDLIIRTSGEKRLSNFLTWQSIYSELFFVDEYWPDFTEAILDKILDEYDTRSRRMGK